MMSQTLCWALAPQRWMAGLSFQKVHCLVTDEPVQIDIYNTGDNCWRIGLFKELWKPKGGSKKLCLLTWWIILVLKDANNIFKNAGESIPGRSNRKCKDREAQWGRKPHLRDLSISLCVGCGQYGEEWCHSMNTLLYQLKNLDFMPYSQRVKDF